MEGVGLTLHIHLVIISDIMQMKSHDFLPLQMPLRNALGTYNKEIIVFISISWRFLPSCA